MSKHYTEKVGQIAEGGRQLLTKCGASRLQGDEVFSIHQFCDFGKYFEVLYINGLSKRPWSETLTAKTRGRNGTVAQLGGKKKGRKDRDGNRRIG